jgi:sugar lactone lactonase YvrE
MRQITICLTLVLIAIIGSSSAMAAKIKHQATVYIDGAGLPLKYPEGVACNGDSFIVADTANSRAVRYTLSAKGLVSDTVFSVPDHFPIVAQVSTKGTIYLLDGKKRQIDVLDASGQLKGLLALKGIPGSQNVQLKSFKVDIEDNLYLLDIFSRRVLILNAEGVFQRQIDFPETVSFISDLAVSSQKNIYLLDSVAGAIYRTDPGADTFSVLTDRLKDVLNFPVGIAVDSSGNIYLSDQYGSGLVELGRDGSFKGRKFGMGWEDGQFYYPAQLCIDSQDNLVIADRNNSRVQVFQILKD